MFKILIVDDNEHLLEFLDLFLTRKGYIIETTSSPIEGLKRCSEEVWDLVLVDFYMDDMDGNTFLKSANNFKNENRIAIFTGFANEKIEYEVLSNRAVDFIYKTNDPKILLKRIEKILEGSKMTNIKLVAKDENLIMDLKNRTLEINEKFIELSNTEFNILKLLLENKNKVLDREFIYDEVWQNDEEYLEENRVIDVHILNIRRKTGVESIITKQGAGYLWKE